MKLALNLPHEVATIRRIMSNIKPVTGYAFIHANNKLDGFLFAERPTTVPEGMQIVRATLCVMNNKKPAKAKPITKSKAAAKPAKKTTTKSAKKATKKGK